jgi:hypothetical protein
LSARLRCAEQSGDGDERGAGVKFEFHKDFPLSGFINKK